VTTQPHFFARREMRSQDIPVVNIADLIERDCTFANYERIGREICDACRSFGFFLVSFADARAATADGSREDRALVESLPRALRALASTTDVSSTSNAELTFARCSSWFARSSEDKARYALSRGQGYQKLRLNVTQGRPDEHEALDFFRPIASRTTQPEIGDDELVRLVNARAKAMCRLGKVTMRAVACGLGLDIDAFEDDVAGCAFWILRLISSPGVSEDEASRMADDDVKLSCGAHSDYGLLTFLEASARGLQIKPSGGEAWIDVPHVPGTLVCNIGEMLSTLTNHEFRATEHRVIRRKRDGAEPRISIAFFYETNYDTVIAPMDQRYPFHSLLATPGAKVYADFLEEKVSTNFAEPDAPRGG